MIRCDRTPLKWADGCNACIIAFRPNAYMIHITMWHQLVTNLGRTKITIRTKVLEGVHRSPRAVLPFSQGKGRVAGTQPRRTLSTKDYPMTKTAPLKKIYLGTGSGTFRFDRSTYRSSLVRPFYIATRSSRGRLIANCSWILLSDNQRMQSSKTFALMDFSQLCVTDNSGYRIE